MRFILCGLLLLAGLSTLAISFKMHGELSELARSPTPQLKDQMVRHLFPTYPPGAILKPHEVARTVTRRIYGIGAVGAVLTIGAFTVIVSMRNRSDVAEE